MPKLMEVLEFLDNSGSTIVKRVPEGSDCEIKWGAQLTVRENQVAVFCRDGRALDVFGPGRHVLQTPNIPVISKWITWFGYGPESPFRAEVYFISNSLFPDLKWGTKTPILFRDKDLQMVRLRAHGIYGFQVSDPLLFLNKMVGTRAVFTDSHLMDYLSNIITSRLTTIFGEQITSILDLPKSYDNLSILARARVGQDFEGLGLRLHDFFVNAIALPQEVEEMVDARSGMSAVGNLDEYLKFKLAGALEVAAANPSGGAGVGMGVGAGAGMGFMLPQAIQSAMNSGGSDSVSPLEKLKQLKELLDLGAITLDEFNEHKVLLLSMI